MAIVKGVNEVGEPAFYDVPDSELSQHKLDVKPLTDEIRNRLFPGKDKLTKEDAQAVIPVGTAQGGDVEGFAALCDYILWDDYGNWVTWTDYC